MMEQVCECINGSHKCGKDHTQIDYLRDRITEEHAYSKQNNKWEQSSHEEISPNMMQNLPLPTELQCEYCTYKTKKDTTLKIHIQRMHVLPYIQVRGRQTKCVLCPQEVTDMKDHYEKNHMNMMTAGEVCMDDWFECKNCDFKCKRKEDMKMHEPKHKWFECKYCGFKTKRKEAMKIHKANHKALNLPHQFSCQSTSLNAYKCKSCKFTTNFKVALSNHVKANHEQKETFFSLLVCNKCNFQTFSILVLTNHLCGMSQDRDDLLDLPATPCVRCKCMPKIYGLKCVNCGSLNHRRCMKLLNMKKISKTQINCCESVETASNSSNVQRKKFETFHQCGKCQGYFKRKNDLKSHVLHKHGLSDFLLQCRYRTFVANRPETI